MVLAAIVACDGGDARDPVASGGLTTVGPSSGSSGAAEPDSDPPSPVSTTGTAPEPATTGEDSGSSTTDAAGSSSEGGDEGPIGSTGYEAPVKCQAVDFLFVIDNSISMAAEQEALVGAFPGFMDTIGAELEAGSDFHVMVLDTDAWGRCETANEPSYDGQSPSHSTCNGYVESTVFEECDRVRGAGVVHPAGEEASNMLCTPSSGGRYIDASEPDLAGMFSCMATVGLAGHSAERPMNAIESAFEPGGDAEACNAGFLREDALLVVTFISDDGGMRDEGTPADWYDSVVAAKGGDPAGVVVLGLGPADPACGGDGGAHWLQFVELWGDRGIHGPVCGSADDYVQFFQDSVAVIDQACEEFVPG